jgi:cell division protein FtsB
MGTSRARQARATERRIREVSMEFPKLDRSRIAAGAVILVAVLIVGGIGWAFVEQLTLAQELRGEEEKLEAMVATREARRDELTATLAYVQSDAYVEEWAREEQKMAKPGEVVVIPVVSAEGGEPEDAPAEGADDGELDVPERPFWVVWWEALFGP